MVRRGAPREDRFGGHGLIVFLPPLFFIEGNGPEAEYAALQGQYEALKEISLKSSVISKISRPRFAGEWILVVKDISAGPARNAARIAADPKSPHSPRR